jgi:hypothetical protein
MEDEKRSQKTTAIDKAGLEAILRDPRSKAALLKKMGLGDGTNKDQNPKPTNRQMNLCLRNVSNYPLLYLEYFA